MIKSQMIIAAFILLSFLPIQAHWARAEFSPDCAEGSPNTSQLNPGTSSILNLATIMEPLDDFQDGKNCFEKLTAEDKAFLNGLIPRLNPSCKAALKAKGSYVECELAALRQLDDGLREYRKSRGAIAADRIITALHAEILRENIANTLKEFNRQPALSEAFIQFEKARQSYRESLSRVQFEDLRPSHSASTLENATSWTQRRLAMGLDLAKSKFPKAFSSRFGEHRKSAEEFLTTYIKLNHAIDATDLPAEAKKKFKSESNLLYSSMKIPYENAQKMLGAEADTALLAAGGVAATALYLESLGIFVSAINTNLGAQIARAAADSVLSGASAGAGISGMTHSAEIALVARADAIAKGSNYVCELSERARAEGSEAVKESIDSALHGGMLAGAMGSTLYAVAKKAPKLSGLLVAMIALHGGVDIAKDFKKSHEDHELAQQELEKTRLAYHEREVTRGDVTQAQNRLDRAEAKITARTIGNTANALIVGLIGLKGTHELLSKESEHEAMKGTALSKTKNTGKSKPGEREKQSSSDPCEQIKDPEQRRDCYLHDLDEVLQYP